MDDLIEIVRQYNVIYDSTCKHYKDHSTRIAVWEEIGQKLNQPSEKCKDDWDKLRNAYINALKRRRKKKSRQAGVILTPWKYEEQMSFLLPFIKSRQSTNHMSRPESPEYFEPSNYISKSPEDFEPSNYLQKSPEPESPQSFQSEHRPETHTKRSRRKKPNLQDLYYLMKSSRSLRHHKPKDQEMDETDMFFLSMSKALKQLPKLDQTKIKLDLHTAISEAEIRDIKRMEQINKEI